MTKAIRMEEDRLLNDSDSPDFNRFFTPVRTSLESQRFIQRASPRPMKSGSRPLPNVATSAEEGLARVG